MKVQPSILRKLNERRVLNSIRVGKAISRAEIQRKLNLTMPTVSRIVDELIANGWVREVGIGEFTLGRPPMMLEINPNVPVALGVDVGREYVRTVCVNLLAEVIAERQVSVQEIQSGTELLNYLKNVMRELAVDESSLVGIGLAAPSPGNLHLNISPPMKLGGIEVGMVTQSNKSILEERISRQLGIPAFMENDANAAVLGEMWFGLGQHAGHLVFVLADEGVGAGIAVNGSIYTGGNGAAGEFSHTIIDVHGDVMCECGRKGCMGGLSHMRAIRRELAQLGRPVQSEQEVFSLAQARVEPEASVVAKTLDYLSVGISNLIQTIDPRMVILGGNVIWSNDFAAQEINERVQKLQKPHAVPVMQSGFGVHAIAIGAATLALQHVYDHTTLMNLGDEPAESAVGSKNVKWAK